MQQGWKGKRVSGREGSELTAGWAKRESLRLRGDQEGSLLGNAG